MGIRGYLLSGQLGFGTAPLGNMFRRIPDEEAIATVEAAWDAGTRFFDTAPFYGAGLAEIRLGKELTKHKREDYVLSTSDSSISAPSLSAFSAWIEGRSIVTSVR